MHIADNIVIQAIKAGASGYVIKDTSRTELVAAIRKVNLGHQYVCKDATDILVDSIYSEAKGVEVGYSPLTNREKEVLQLIVEGYSTKQIASDLYISPKTVVSHRVNIIEKLQIHNLPELTKYAIEIGLISTEM